MRRIPALLMQGFFYEVMLNFERFRIQNRQKK